MLIEGRYYSETELISLFKKMQKQTAELTSECIRLKNVVSMNSESQKIADGVIEQLKQENAELKTENEKMKSEFEEFKNIVIPCVDISKKNHKINELTKYLRLAMHDFERVTKMCTEIQCDSCPHEYMGNYELANGCIWKYKEQALKLIGGDE